MSVQKISSDIDEAIEFCSQIENIEKVDDCETRTKFFKYARVLMSNSRSPMVPYYLRTKALFGLYNAEKEMPDSGKLASEVLITITDSLDMCEGSILENTLNVLEKVVSSNVFNSEQRYLVALNCYNSGLIECYNDFFSILIEDTTMMLEHRIECAKFLFYSGSEEYLETTLKFMKEMIENRSLQSKYRYESIACFITNTGVSTRYNTDRLAIVHDVEFVFPLQKLFFFDEENGVRERLLSAQYLLQTDEHPEVFDDVQTHLFSIATSTTVGLDERSESRHFGGTDKLTEEQIAQKLRENNHNIRADAADILVRLGTTKEIRERAAEIQGELGREDIKSALDDTIYSNKQNIHSTKIQEATNKFLEKIYTEERNVPVFHEVHQQILNYVNEQDLTYAQNLNIHRALDRISVDSAKFTRYMLTSSRVLCYIWHKVLSHQQKDLLKVRFIEELMDMADTCSTGHCSRLVNVLTAFEEDGIMIGIDDQLIANISARIHTRIGKVEDEEEKGKIVCGTIEPTDNPTAEEVENRNAYIQFIEGVEDEIRQELHEEFVGQGFISERRFIEQFDSQLEKLK